MAPANLVFPDRRQRVRRNRPFDLETEDPNDGGPPPVPARAPSPPRTDNLLSLLAPQYYQSLKNKKKGPPPTNSPHRKSQGLSLVPKNEEKTGQFLRNRSSELISQIYPSQLLRSAEKQGDDVRKSQETNEGSAQSNRDLSKDQRGASLPSARIFGDIHRVVRDFCHIPHDQRELLRSSSSLYPPAPGCTFPVGNIPIALLMDSEFQQQLGSTANIRSEAGNANSALPVNDCASRIYHRTIETVSSSKREPSSTLQTEADSLLEGWEATPSPVSRPRQQAQDLPPDSSPQARDSDDDEMEIDVPLPSHDDAVAQIARLSSMRRSSCDEESEADLEDLPDEHLVPQRTGVKIDVGEPTFSANMDKTAFNFAAFDPAVELVNSGTLRLNLTKERTPETSSSSAREQRRKNDDDANQRLHTSSNSAKTTLIPCTQMSAAQQGHDTRELQEADNALPDDRTGVDLQLENEIFSASQRRSDQTPQSQPTDTEQHKASPSSQNRRTTSTQPNQNLESTSCQHLNCRADARVSSFSSTSEMNRYESSQHKEVLQDPAVQVTRSSPHLEYVEARHPKRRADSSLSPSAPALKLPRYGFSQLEDVSQDPALEAVQSKTAFISRLQQSLRENNPGTHSSPRSTAVGRGSRSNGYELLAHDNSGERPRHKVNQGHKALLDEQGLTDTKHFSLLYEVFCSKYRDFTSDEKKFEDLCTYVYGISHRLPETMWDDFVYKFAKEGYVEYLLERAQRGEEPMSYEQYYQRKNSPQRCHEGIITKTTLAAFLNKPIEDSFRPQEVLNTTEVKRAGTEKGSKGKASKTPEPGIDIRAAFSAYAELKANQASMRQHGMSKSSNSITQAEGPS